MDAVSSYCVANSLLLFACHRVGLVLLDWRAGPWSQNITCHGCHENNRCGYGATWALTFPRCSFYLFPLNVVLFYFLGVFWLLHSL